MCTKPDNRELSLQTGFLFPIYLDLIRLIKNLNECREHLEKTEPWYDKPRHPRSWYDASKPYADLIQLRQKINKLGKDPPQTGQELNEIDKSRTSGAIENDLPGTVERMMNDYTIFHPKMRQNLGRLQE